MVEEANKIIFSMVRVSKFYDKFTDIIANHITAPIMNSKLIQKASDKWKESDFLFNHVATVTSAVISCVYMQRTLSNKNLEESYGECC